LAQAFEPLGAQVIAVPISKLLHLRSAIGAIPNETIVGWSVQVDDLQNIKDNYLMMPEESGAHVVILDDSKILMASDGPQSANIFKNDYKLDVLEVDISEYQKLDGCVTCLSVRIRELQEDSPLLSQPMKDQVITS
jgi:dimethylargininase